jgi:cystathionine beta-lyase
MQKKSVEINTKCVHAGTYIDDKGYGVNTPIFASTAHLFPNPESEVRYPRCYNIPTQRAVVDKLCALEGGEAGLVTSSGMAAISTVILGLVKNGEHAIFQSGLYGGTQHFINSELGRFGIGGEIINSNDPNKYSEAIQPNTRTIYLESPTNPLLDVIDLKAIADIAREKNILTIVDNTFATPVNQNPLALGIDIVVHSGTKYLNGHSDVCCGAIVTSSRIMERLSDHAVIHGPVLDTHAYNLLERGLKTLGLRVEHVYYPGLGTHPGYTIAKEQMRGFGGMLSFELDCDVETAKKITSSLEIITSAVSLGGVETLLCFPAETSHAELPPEVRSEQGITDSLIRLSVGIEDVDDLISDLEYGFSKIN